MPAHNFVIVHFHVPTKFKQDGSIRSSSWLRALRIPIASLEHFSPRHYKWIRYLCYCLTGVKGNLSTSKSSTNWLDTSTARITRGVNLYFHLPHHDGFYPIDHDIAAGSIHTDRSQRAGSFKAALLERDGRCVVTDDRSTSSLRGAHLLAFAKGDQYIQAFTEGRQCPEVIRDINDIRNGLLVTSTVHDRLGKNMAILPIPNFALKKSDIAIQARTDKRGRRVETSDGSQWIVHHFDPDPDTGASDIFSPHAAPIYLPARITKGNWPPVELFCAVYGQAAIARWMLDTFSSKVRKAYKDRFYPGGARNSREGGSQQLTEQQKRRREETNSQSRARDTRATKRQKRYTDDGNDDEQEGDSGDRNNVGNDVFGLLVQLYQLSGGLSRPQWEDAGVKIDGWLQGVAAGA